MDKNVKVIYKKITRRFKEKGYINLNHRPVNTKDDLVEIASIFRSPEYETFRMVYMKENHIVGYESVSSRTPACVPLFQNKKTGNINYERGIYKMKNQMERLGADSYYMVHNHPSGHTKASSEDILTTRYFIEKLEGFKGHLIIGIDSYAWIEKDKNYYENLRIENFIPINFKKVDKMSKMLNKKSIYDVKISSKDDLFAVMHNIVRTKGYSTAILTDSTNQVRMILDIPNTMLNQSTKQLNGYFKNLARENGVSGIFFATSDNKTFTKSLEHLKFGTFKDSICYKELEKEKLALCEVSDIKPKKTLFYDETEKPKKPVLNFSVMSFKEKIELQKKGTLDFEVKEKDDENDYVIIPLEKKKIDLDKEDTFEPKKNQIKVLYKRVGKEPIIKVIENTLEDKQALVGGLIEVVPYLDDTLIICNEEGKILNMEPNVVFDYDYIAGDFFVIGDDYEHGDFKSLTKEEIEEAKKDLMRRSFKKMKKNNEERPKQRNREFEL